MEPQRHEPFRIGKWLVEPALNRLSKDSGDVAVMPKAMAVLLALAAHPGEVVTTDELVQAVWAGRPMGDNPVYKCIAVLRKALGDDQDSAAYIETIPTRGYRLVAKVRPAQPPAVIAAAPRRQTLLWLGVAALAAAIVWQAWRADGPARTEQGGDPQRVMLAVLPFEQLGGDPMLEYFRDGLSEEIVAALSRLSPNRLGVVARSSSFVFKGGSYDARRISELLGVEYLLRGSVRQEKKRLRISAALEDNAGLVVWSDVFERELGEIFSLQEEIALAVAGRIVSQIEWTSNAGRHPDIAVYQQYVIGRELLIRRPPDFYRRAREALDRAIAADPAYAAAYAERAIASLFAAARTADWQALDSAQRDIDMALALDPDTAQAYAAQGFLLQSRVPAEYAASEAPLRRALGLDPNLVNAWNWLSQALFHAEKWAEAGEALRTAARIDPLSPPINANLAIEEAQRGLADEAELRLLRLLEVPQPSELAHHALIIHYLETGRPDEALGMAKRLILLTAAPEDQAARLQLLIPIYRVLGAWQRVDEWQTRIMQEAPDKPQARLDMAEALLSGTGRPVAGEIAELGATGEMADLALVTSGAHRRLMYGIVLALAGEDKRAAAVLGAMLDPRFANQGFESDQETNARQALAWLWLRAGETAKANTLLAALDEQFKRQAAADRLHRSVDLFEYARNQVLRGDTEAAAELLEAAEKAGWRGYYGVRHDPRWNAVRDAMRFQAVMARVKADLDRRLEAVERREAADDFAARLDAVLAAKRAG